MLALKTYENAYTFEGRTALATATYIFARFLSMVKTKLCFVNDIQSFCSLRAPRGLGIFVFSVEVFVSLQWE